MKIVVLDGYCLNPGDLSWDDMARLGDLDVYDRTSPEQVVERAADAAAIITNKTVISIEIMSQLPNLLYVGVLATGYNVVDVKAAEALGIVVTNIPAYSTASVAQMVFAHILNITQNVGHYAAQNRKLHWSNSVDFSYVDTPLMELFGKTIGIIGLGRTGMATARIALAFGMRVIAFTSKQASLLPQGIQKASNLDEVFSTADIVSLHCPLNETTLHIVSQRTLSLMKKSSILINTGRGRLVDEDALAEALNSGQIYAAGVDVMAQEPPAADNPLLSARNFYCTPHIAWATLESRQRLMALAVGNLQAFIAGKPINVVSA